MNQHPSPPPGHAERIAAETARVQADLARLERPAAPKHTTRVREALVIHGQGIVLWRLGTGEWWWRSADRDGRRGPFTTRDEAHRAAHQWVYGR